MAGLPIAIPLPGESAIASYSYTDVAEGTGIQVFYAAATCTGSATYDYILTGNSSFYSALNGYSTLNSFDQTFEVTFNSPRTIKGDAFVAVPVWLYASVPSRSGYIKATLYKNAEVIGVETQSETMSGDATTPKSYFSLVVQWTVAQTHFKIGDILKLRIQGTASGGGGSITDIIGFSPVGGQLYNASNDANLSKGDGTLSLYIPFKLDL